MNFNDVIKEELNSPFVSKELAGLTTIKKQLDVISNDNPLVSNVLKT